jgi:hypothetical protein
LNLLEGEVSDAVVEPNDKGDLTIL